MQDAMADVEVTTSNPKHVLMLGALVMHAYLVCAHPHQRKLTGRIIHCVAPTNMSQVQCQ